MAWVETEDYEAKEQTGRRMYELCEAYWPDLGMRICLPFREWFNRVRKIPYVADSDLFPKRTVEVIGRPGVLLTFPRLDCKKKAILVGAYSQANGIPYRFIACSEKPNREIHHVFPQVRLGGEWVAADATLPDYYLGQPKQLTRAEELLP